VQTTKELPIDGVHSDLTCKSLINEFTESISGDNVKMARDLCRFLSEKAAWESCQQSEHVKSLCLQELQQLIDSHSKTLLVFDWEVLESCMGRISSYYSFLNGLRILSSEPGQFVVIVSEKPRAEL